MKRRTFRQLRSKAKPELHHNVYVVLLKPAVGKLRKVRAENPNRDSKKPCLYVGLTGLKPEERFANHKAGIKAAAVVKRYGVRLLPELFTHLNPGGEWIKEVSRELVRNGEIRKAPPHRFKPARMREYNAQCVNFTRNKRISRMAKQQMLIFSIKRPRHK